MRFALEEIYSTVRRINDVGACSHGVTWTKELVTCRIPTTRRHSGERQ